VPRHPLTEPCPMGDALLWERGASVLEAKVGREVPLAAVAGQWCPVVPPHAALSGQALLEAEVGLELPLVEVAARRLPAAPSGGSLPVRGRWQGASRAGRRSSQ